MKKLFVGVLIASALVSAQPRQSQAVIGAFTGGGVLVVGAVLTGLGVVGVVPAFAGLFDCYDKYDPHCSTNEVIAAVPLVLGAWGLILLDESSQPSIQYHALTDDQAATLGLTSSQLLAYNDERLQIQAVSDQITAETAAQSKVDANAAHLSAFAHSRWTEYSQMLSPDAFSAVQVMVGQLK